MKPVLLIAILTVSLIALMLLGKQMLRPIPFLTKKELGRHEQYKKIAKKLSELESIKLDRKVFPARKDFVAKLMSSNIYTIDELMVLAGGDCLNSNRLYESGIVFWIGGDKAVSYVDEYWHVHIESKNQFAFRLER